MHKLNLLLLLAVCIGGHAQDYSFPTDIQVKKTSFHKNAPGTHLYIIPPPGYQFFPHQSFMMNSEFSKLSFKEWPDVDYYSNINVYSRDTLATMADKIYYFHSVTVNGLPGIISIFRNRKDTANIAFRLVFGDKSFMAALVIHARSGDAAGIRQAKNFLENVYYDKAKYVSPFALEDFTMDTASTAFHLTDWTSRKGRPSGRTYWFDLKQPLKSSPFQPYAYVRRVLMYLSGKDSVSFVIGETLSSFKEDGYEVLRYEHESNGKIDGLNFYQAEIYCRKKNDIKEQVVKDEELLYLYILFIGDETAVTLAGVTKSDPAKWIAAYKHLAATIRKK